jgi:chitinase
MNVSDDFTPGPHIPRHFFTVLLLAAAFLVPLPGTAQSAAPSKRLLGYYPEWAKTGNPPYSAKQIPYHKLTHIAHAFVLLTAKADGTFRAPAGMIEPALISRAHAAGVKVLVSIGGGDGIQGPRFNRMAAVEAHRKAFVRNVHAFLTKYGYDGVDIDWEVPNAKDRKHCTTLMTELRAELPAPSLISMATPSDPRQWGVGFDIPALAPLVDFMNVMTYDFHGPWTDHSGHNSPLILNPNDPGLEGSLKTSMDLYQNHYRVPVDKLNIGTAFYGYEFDGVSALWEHCTSCTTTGRNYGTYIKPRINRQGWTAYYDDVAKAPYLLDPSLPGFITYDDVASSERKTRYVLKHRGFGGVFTWELSADYDGSSQDLIEAMYKGWKSSR